MSEFQIPLNHSATAAFEQSRAASVVFDRQSLEGIRQLGRQDKLAAIQQAAKEFEGFFLNMMLKSMRSASEVIAQDSPLFSNEQKMFTAMLDEQLANNLSMKGSLGIADLLTRQLARVEGLATKKEKGQPVTGFLHRTPSALSRSTNNPVTNEPQGEFVPEKYWDIADDMRVLQFIASHQAQAEKAIQHQNLTEQDIDAETMKPLTLEQTKTMGIEQTKPKRGVAERKTLFESAYDFVRELAPYAKKAARLLNIHPAVVLSQAALETGWGKYVMHDQKGQSGFNLFGIKSGGNWRGETIEMPSLEVESGEFKPVVSEFRSYQSLGEAFDDYVNFLISNPRYEGVLSAKTAEDFAQALQAAGYATDPEYSTKILRVLNSDLMKSFFNSADETVR